MKLNKDNYELVMFDLLEGNLSEADELRVMEQIEGDEFLFREWKLFKSTVLIAEKDVVFAGKSSLLKEEEKVAVIALFKPWMAVAASVAILAVAFVFWPTSDAPKMADTPVVEKNTTEDIVSPKIESEELLVTEELVNDNSIATERLKNRIDTKNNNKGSRAIEKDFPARSVTVDISPGYKTSKEEQLAQTFMQQKIDAARKRVDEQLLDKYNETKRKEQEEIRIAQVDKNNEKVEQIDYTLKPKDIEPKRPAEDIASEVTRSPRERFISFVTNKPIERITTTTAAILVKARNPKLKVKPDFKSTRPSLNIEFESEGYEVIASLQPFKNKNN